MPAPGEHSMERRDPMACDRCGVVHDPTKCNAHARSGKQCSHPPILGAKVCRFHGGAAPQTVAKAKARLLAAADPAAEQLVKLTRSKDEHVAFRAATAVLDRAGLGKDWSNGPGALDMPTVDPQLVVSFITNVLTRLGVAITDDVRDVVSSELRAMSAAARAPRDAAELIDA